MKMIRLYTILILVTVIVLSIPVTSSACSCAEKQSVEGEFMQSMAVFRGVVIGTKDTSNSKRVLFDVLENWKGANQSQIIIQTGLGGGDCGIDFQVGEEYLVYASEQLLSDSDNYLSTGICDRTIAVQSVENDFDILGQGMSPTKDVELEKEFNRVFPEWMVTGFWTFVSCLGIFGVWAIWSIRRKAK
ncbi:hypothetical protein [Ornithinibacillus bavariensis]|nr:hypothetical protein [Ornithinibacillus bavariensis]